MKCLVTIKGAGGALFSSSGDLKVDGGAIELSYRIDGDECELYANGKEVREKRRGSVCLDLYFVEGARTFGTLREGENFGEIPVFTHSVIYRITPVGAELQLGYESGGEKILLRLDAEYLGENKWK